MSNILVWPRDEDVRKFIKHPLGHRFSNYPNGTLWPLDQFTMRRLRDGAILTKATTFDPAPAQPAQTIEPSPIKPPAATPSRRRRQVMEK